ncbi:thermosome subunit alpha [Acrasis kona]|uniref:Thermosome subunit alpha n=1 Tax=Acrasis kona TaxID=1008807 RepID=A0AAW2ZF99_9EUKA
MKFYDQEQRRYQQNGCESCNHICDNFVHSSYGPSGAFKMIQTPGGRLTITTSIQRIFLALQNRQQEKQDFDFHPVAQILMKSAQAHSQIHVGDNCGSFIMLATSFLNEIIKSQQASDYSAQLVCESITFIENEVIKNHLNNLLHKISQAVKGQSGDTLLLSYVIQTQLVSNVNKKISKCLSDLLLTFILNKHGSTTVDIKKNLIDLMHFYDECVVTASGAAVQSSQLVKGLLLENTKALSFMPSEIWSPTLFVMTFSSSEDYEEETEQDVTLTFDVSKMGGMNKIKELNVNQMISFVQLLNYYKIRLVIVKGGRFDPELLRIMSQSRILCVQNISENEMDLLCKECKVEPMVIKIVNSVIDGIVTQLHLTVPDVIDSHHLTVIKNVKEVPIGVGRSIIHITPEDSSFHSILLRGPIDDISNEYRNLLKRVVVNLNYQVCEELGRNMNVDFELSYLPGAGAIEATLSSLFDKLSRDVENSHVTNFVLQALSNSYRSLCMQLISNNIGSNQPKRAILEQFRELCHVQVTSLTAGHVSLKDAPTLSENDFTFQSAIIDCAECGVLETFSSKYLLLIHVLQTVSQIIRVHCMMPSKKINVVYLLSYHSLCPINPFHLIKVEKSE